MTTTTKENTMTTNRIVGYWQHDGQFGGPDASLEDTLHIISVMETLAEDEGYDLTMKRGIGRWEYPDETVDHDLLVDRWYQLALDSL